MPWQFWFMFLGIVAMFFGGGLGARGKEGAALVLSMTGFAMFIIGGVMMPDPPMSRHDAARATIAAATATAMAWPTEAALATLEAQAAEAATAAHDAGGGE